jgi:uncharacterized RDD family membrane protein YckC
MTDNAYTPPQADLIEGVEQVDNLATRMQRFLASWVDGLIMMAVTIPVMYFTGGFEGISEGVKPGLVYTLAIAVLGLVVFVLINGKLLAEKGQTIGKKVLGIKIVDLEGALPDVQSNLVPRYAVYFLPGQVPVVGQLFAFVNILFIFGKQKRCIHDLAGKTRVVVA